MSLEIFLYIYYVFLPFATFMGEENMGPVLIWIFCLLMFTNGIIQLDKSFIKLKKLIFTYKTIWQEEYILRTCGSYLALVQNNLRTKDRLLPKDDDNKVNKLAEKFLANLDKNMKKSLKTSSPEFFCKNFLYLGNSINIVSEQSSEGHWPNLIFSLKK